jgi:glutamate/tyrosine decarboxylase-like PLP-dependent enzyme
MNPAEFRDAGHHIVDILADYLSGIEDRRVFPDVEPRKLYEMFDEPLPEDPEPPEDVIDEVTRKVLPYSTHVGHPGYFGLITPSPTPMGALADLIASAINQNPGAYTIGPAAVAIERRTVAWLTQLAGYGPGAGGNLTSGGMMANFIGLKVGRDWASGDTAQHDGIDSRWAVYVSEERHVSVDKAVDAIGLGRRALRALPTDDAFQLRIDALEQAIARDKQDGVRPMIVVGMFGSTNTGAVDDIRALRTIADREHMWLHVDAAYGGGMLLSREHPMRDRGVELADSITIDPHKWFYAPLDVGAVLVKDERRLTHSFGMKPAYLTDEMDRANERYQFYVHGFEQSRRFRALKVWMTFKRYGARQIADWIDANVAQARHLYDVVRQRSDFVAASAPPMSAICIRYVAPGLSEADLGILHAEVARAVEAAGRFWISTTELKGRSWFRINPVNFRTRLAQMDELLESLRIECERARRELASDRRATAEGPARSEAAR